MPFAPGQSGNPGGRRRGSPFADALRMEIAAAGDDPLRLRRIARALIETAEAGDMAAIREVADRLDGKPLQQVETTHDGAVQHVISAVPLSEAQWQGRYAPAIPDGYADPDRDQALLGAAERPAGGAPDLPVP